MVNKYNPDYIILLPPATRLGQGYIFTGVCDSVRGGVRGQGAYVVGGMHGQGACMAWGGMHGQGGLCGGGHVWQGGGACVAGGVCVWHAPGHTPLADTTATAYSQWAGGMHPTGMHSCCNCVLAHTTLCGRLSVIGTSRMCTHCHSTSNSHVNTTVLTPSLLTHPLRVGR